MGESSDSFSILFWHFGYVLAVVKGDSLLNIMVGTFLDAILYSYVLVLFLNGRFWYIAVAIVQPIPKQNHSDSDL